MLATFYDSYNILSKVYVGGAFIKQAMTETSIEERNRPKITKICYGVLDKDVTLEYYISVLCKKSPKRSVKIFLKIGMYSIKYLENPPYAVVDNLVKLMKKMGKNGVSGFVNSFLRKFSSCEIEMPKDEIKYLSVLYSYPEFAARRLISDYGRLAAEKIMGADTERTTLRFNIGVNGEDYLSAIGANYEKTPFENVFMANAFKRNSDYDDGVYTFQSIGSVAICEMVGEGERLLDACAAPGGKSVNLSDKFKEVISCDIHPHRVELVRLYAQRMKKTNISAICANSAEFNAEFKEGFDCVLLDAPCSGYGVIKDNPDIKLRRTENDVKELALLQSEIINNVSKYVKKGGTLCYSTCSIFKEENEKVCEKFLSENADFEEVKTDSPLPHLKLKRGVAFLPHISLGAGFYFCKFVKKT